MDIRQEIGQARLIAVALVLVIALSVIAIAETMGF